MENKTIIEAYIEFNKELIIIVSGLSGTGKYKVAKSLARDLNIKLIDSLKYCNKKYKNKVKSPFGDEFINWDSDDTIDWEKLNKDVNKQKNKGVVITGIAFPKEKLDFTPTYHVQIKLSKQNLLLKRHEYIEGHKEDCNDISKHKGTQLEKYILNNYTYPYYINFSERSLITKYVNGNDYINESTKEYYEKIYDDTFNYIINEISEKLK